jgi:hypothetical protein
MLCAIVQNVFAWRTWYLELVQSWPSNNATIVQDRICINSGMVTRIYTGLNVP